MSRLKGFLSPSNLQKHLKTIQIEFARTYQTLNHRLTHNNCPLLTFSHTLKQSRSKYINSSSARFLLTSQRSASSQSDRQVFTDLSIDQSCQSLRIKTGGSALQLPLVWLRDHCRSPRCYNHQTFQKNADPELLQRSLEPQAVSLAEDGALLCITWKDGHKSEFSSHWILDNFYPAAFSRVTQRIMWDAKDIKNNLPKVEYSSHLGTDAGLKETLRNLLTYGFCMVEGAPASMEATQAAVERVTFVLETLFGGMWQFTSDASRSDTAYSSLALGAHTDGSYMDLPAGIQVFHCLKHTGQGGETLLVDGFNAAHKLKSASPAWHARLASTVVPHEYREPRGEGSVGWHLYSHGTVLRCHPNTGDMVQLRFNPYDRAPLNTVQPSEIQEFYKAYDKLAHIIAQPEGELWVKLQPGTVLFIDNWRVMHGRSAFDGERTMCGCYLPRDEWVSRARTMGLL